MNFAARSMISADKLLGWDKLVFVLLAFVCAAAVALATTPLAKRLAVKLGIIDVPKDARRMHKDSVPMLGGLAIYLGTVVAALIFLNFDTTLVAGFAGATIIFVLGVFDDRFDIPAWIKLVVQLVAASIPVIFGLRIEFVALADSKIYLEWLAVPITVLWIVGITNAVNFIDGLDGLACGVSLISAASLCFLAVFLGRDDSAVITAAVAGACLGFLPYNRHPAKIFMGDCGATFLGYLMAFVSVYGLFKTSAFISLAGPVIIMALPIFDALWAIVRRVAKGQSPMTADRGHLHHRLIDSGVSHKVAVRIVHIICIMFSLLAIVFAFFGVLYTLILAAALAAVSVIAVKLHKKEKNEKQ